MLYVPIVAERMLTQNELLLATEDGYWKLRQLGQLRPCTKVLMRGHILMESINI